MMKLVADAALGLYALHALCGMLIWTAGIHYIGLAPGPTRAHRIAVTLIAFVVVVLAWFPMWLHQQSLKRKSP